MARSNYALISALYADKSRGLYSDIYFPIIKYAIVKLFGSKEKGEHYATSDDVQKLITELFGVKIPHVVIAKTVLKLSRIEKSSIRLNVFEEGNTFQITSAFFDEDEVSFKEREFSFNRHLSDIESEYKAFVEREGICGDGMTFTEFISNNTDNILGYFENDSETQVEEKYTSMVFFLEYLNRENHELYKTANQLFWGSVIAAFLQSDRPNVHDEERGCESEFYLDTSIAMGLLDLSTPENELSAKDVCDIIKSSGGILKLHPVTIEEMKAILESVAQNGAYPGTSIANACLRRNLLAPEITKIRLNLQKAIESKGVQIFPSSMPDCRRQVMSRYKGKPILRELASIWNDNAGTEVAQSLFFSDQFREAHDIFMDDYIQEQRRIKNGKEKVFFLTTNIDLITFCKNRHIDASYMISTSKVILELWMHNAQPAKVSASALTETMARCLDLHRSKVRAKLHEVARFFNRNKEEIAPDVYNEFLRLLYRRARNVVAAVDQIPEGDSKAFVQKLQDAISEDQSHYDAINSKINSEKESLKDAMLQQGKELTDLSKESEQKSQEIGSLRKKNEELTDQKSKLTSDLEGAKKELNHANAEKAKLKKEKEKSDRLNTLYSDRDELTDKIIHLRAMLDPLEKARCDSYKNKTPWVLMILGIVCFATFGVLVVLNITKVVEIDSWDLSLARVTLGVFLITTSLTLNSEDRKKSRKEKAYAEWDKNHPNYTQLKGQIHGIEEKLRLAKEEISSITS